MKFKWPLLFLLCVASAHAQMYRWVDASGKVNFSDQPPPASVKKPQKSSATSSEPSGENLNYGLSEEAKDFPVTLYSSSDCAPCSEGRSLLKNRGIPFSEKTISTNEDLAQLKQVGGNGQLPFLTVGRTKLTGFEADAWNSALSVAGYPQSSQLPSNYKYSAPQAAAPTPAAIEKPSVKETPTAPPQAPTDGSTPPGFRF
jgi:glutaredoxin